MAPRHVFVVLGVIISLVQVPVNALPPMNIKKLYGTSLDGKFSREDDSSFPQPDEDVLELEQLKQRDSSSNYEPINREDSLPALQKQLEFEATKSTIDLGQREEEEPTIVQHRPSQNLQPPTNPEPLNPDITSSSFEKPSSKPFYGAARLAFGQNPEIITSTPTATTSTAAIPAISTNITITTSTTTVSPTSNTETEDLLTSELEATKNGERRSINVMPPKTAESLLRHKDGQYSSFDMAQYVFWTGDEAGVARAVEEFIQQGLMSRENAIKFLKDIRVGIEYLQNSYNNRIVPSHMKSAPSYMSASNAAPTIPPLIITKGMESIQSQNPNSKNPNLQKALEGIPSLFRLQEMSNSRSKDNNIDYDEVAGRMRLAEFLYSEYSLEEVIYQLAKVMFSQALTHGSDQSQSALQRLTEFLETEGEKGRISPNLQKKILDVLLAALSDTLAEHPELLVVARSGLGNAFHKLQQNNVDRVKN